MKTRHKPCDDDIQIGWLSADRVCNFVVDYLFNMGKFLTRTIAGF